MTVAVPPPIGLHGPPVDIEAHDGAQEDPPPPTACWTCELEDSEGKKCGRVFRTRRAPVAHQRFSKGGGHSCRSVIHTITITNE
eukprot:1418033-Pyramimonas_sp.AAC.1